MVVMFPKEYVSQLGESILRLRVYTNVSTELLTYAVGVAPVLNVSLMKAISVHSLPYSLS